MGFLSREFVNVPLAENVTFAALIMLDLRVMQWGTSDSPCAHQDVVAGFAYEDTSATRTNR